MTNKQNLEMLYFVHIVKSYCFEMLKRNVRNQTINFPGSLKKIRVTHIETGRLVHQINTD